MTNIQKIWKIPKNEIKIEKKIPKIIPKIRQKPNEKKRNIRSFFCKIFPTRVNRITKNAVAIYELHFTVDVLGS